MIRTSVVDLAGCFIALLMVGFTGESQTARDPKALGSPLDPEKPGYEMSRLNEFAGNWGGEVKFCKEHGQGEKAKVGSTSRVDYGGFWLVSDCSVMTGKGPFREHSLLGYDQARQEYVLTTVNSMCSQLTVLRGSWDEELRQLILRGDATGPDRKPWHLTAIYSLGDEQHFGFSLIGSNDKIKDCPCVTISFVRRDEAPPKHHPKE